MNVYQKLQQVRVDLQKINPKKTGNNTFAGYTYYELGDFIPYVNNLMEQYNLTSCISFGDIGCLEIINAEKPDERILFTAPMSTAQLKGCNEVQNLGAVITYIRRYLWTNALELTEHDALGATTGKETPQKPVQQTKPAEPPKTPQPQQNANTEPVVVNEAQIKRLYAICKEHGKNQDDLKDYMMLEFGFNSSKKLNKSQYDQTCKWAEGGQQ